MIQPPGSPFCVLAAADEEQILTDRCLMALIILSGNLVQEIVFVAIFNHIQTQSAMRAILHQTFSQLFTCHYHFVHSWNYLKGCI